MRSTDVQWAAAGLLLAISYQLAVEHLWIVGLLPLVAWFVAGVLLVLIPLVQSARSENRPASLRIAARSGVVVATAMLLVWPVCGAGAWATMHARFAINHQAYDRVVEHLQVTPPTASGFVSEHQATVDLGPPMRVAFLWPGGIIDNWCGAVYDPTREVLKANAFTGDWEAWHDQVPVRIIQLFGGDLLSCRELTSTYFHCCFT